MTMLALLCTAVVGMAGGARLVSVLLAMFLIWPALQLGYFAGICARWRDACGRNARCRIHQPTSCCESSSAELPSAGMEVRAAESARGRLRLAGSHVGNTSAEAETSRVNATELRRLQKPGASFLFVLLSFDGDDLSLSLPEHRPKRAGMVRRRNDR